MRRRPGRVRAPSDRAPLPPSGYSPLRRERQNRSPVLGPSPSGGPTLGVLGFLFPPLERPHVGGCRGVIPLQLLEGAGVLFPPLGRPEGPSVGGGGSGPARWGVPGGHPPAVSTVGPCPPPPFGVLPPNSLTPLRSRGEKRKPLQLSRTSAWFACGPMPDSRCPIAVTAQDARRKAHDGWPWGVRGFCSLPSGGPKSRMLGEVDPAPPFWGVPGGHLPAVSSVGPCPPPPFGVLPPNFLTPLRSRGEKQNRSNCSGRPLGLPAGRCPIADAR
jgi:hypothetical protein